MKSSLLNNQIKTDQLPRIDFTLFYIKIEPLHHNSVMYTVYWLCINEILQKTLARAWSRADIQIRK